MATFLELAWEG